MKPEFTTMRGTLNTEGFSSNLIAALMVFDRERRAFTHPEQAYLFCKSSSGSPFTRRLIDGLQRITLRGKTRILSKHSGVCKAYVREKTWDLPYLFFWDDGDGEARRRLFLRAWQRGFYPEQAEAIRKVQGL